MSLTQSHVMPVRPSIGWSAASVYSKKSGETVCSMRTVERAPFYLKKRLMR
jgi:hypothetical protein